VFTVLKDDEEAWMAAKKEIGEKIKQGRSVARRYGEVVRFEIFVELRYEQLPLVADDVVEKYEEEEVDF
jgi:hypothetical protein